MATYRVKAGDTLGKIAKRFYGDPSRYTLIVNANALANPDKLKVGQELVIPYGPEPAAPQPPARPAARTTPAPPAPPPSPPLPPPPAPPRPAPAPVAAGNRTAQLNGERLAKLHPIVAVRGHSMLELCAHDGLSLLVTQAVRTWEEQDALYAQGRTAPGKIVTNAKGGESFHNFGLAFDIVVLDAIGKADWNVEHEGWARAAKLGKSAGLEWGGDWTGFKDMPHFQYTGGLTIKQCQALYAGGGGLPAVWAKVK